MTFLIPLGLAAAVFYLWLCLQGWKFVGLYVRWLKAIEREPKDFRRSPFAFFTLPLVGFFASDPKLVHEMGEIMIGDWAAETSIEQRQQFHDLLTEHYPVNHG